MAVSEVAVAMHGDFIGVLFSVLLIGVGYLAHELIRKKDLEVARKVLHIWVSNWYFIYLYCFDNMWPAIAGLAAFALFNLCLEVAAYHTHRYGTIYYPLSIIAMLCLQSFNGFPMRAIGCGVLAMGYGDGLAAIVGSKTHSRNVPFCRSKTLFGSLTMFVVTTVIVLLFTHCSILTALVIGLIATLAEAYFPFSLDNVAVPLVVFFLVGKLC